jgi:hypothetical protein
MFRFSYAKNHSANNIQKFGITYVLLCDIDLQIAGILIIGIRCFLFVC